MNIALNSLQDQRGHKPVLLTRQKDVTTMRFQTSTYGHLVDVAPGTHKPSGQSAKIRGESDRLPGTGCGLPDPGSRHRSSATGGMTLIELMTVLAILALAGAVAVPHMLDWRHGMRLRAAANEIRNDFELARMRSVKENTDVTVQFDPTAGLYRVTYNDDGGNAVLVKSHTLPPGILIATGNAAYTLDSYGHRAVFGSRGTASPGTLVLANSKGATRQIVINFLGRVDLRN
jgi:prepilin-type N-terminal cleavage/methylation domain-containing protein